MIGLIIAVVIGILIIGLVLKLLKIAIIVALCVGVVMFARNKLSGSGKIRGSNDNRRIK